MAMRTRNETIRLRDGRSLCYATWGNEEGKPVVLLHGAPGSRLFCPSDSVTASCGVKLITVDRPGYGRSDFQEGRRLLDWPDDVAQLAEALALDRFAVVGHSSGGPYALACAVSFGPRLTQVGLVSTAVPIDEIPRAYQDLDEEGRGFVDLARRDPAKAMESMADGARWLEETPEKFLDAPRPDPDRSLLGDPDVRAMYLEMIRESARQGVLKSYAYDEVLVTALPWGFPLENIGVQVRLWHGDQDPYIPRVHIEDMARLLPNCDVTFYPNEAHGLIVRKWEEILTALT
jgi:pimeloyl-ACP methyl ester carboxylesterase